MKSGVRLKYRPGDPGDFLRVDAAKCNACGECARFCPRGVWKKDADVYRPAAPGLCAECGACWNVCPADAVIMDEPRGGTGVRFSLG